MQAITHTSPGPVVEVRLKSDDRCGETTGREGRGAFACTVRKTHWLKLWSIVGSLTVESTLLEPKIDRLVMSGHR